MLATVEQQPKRGGQRKYMAHMNGAQEQGQEILHSRLIKAFRLNSLTSIEFRQAVSCVGKLLWKGGL